MEFDLILGKIIELTKNIYLEEPKEKSYKRSFFINSKRIAYEFWITKTGMEICKEIALMSMQYNPALKNGDINSFKEIIKEVFENIIFNEKLFDCKLVFGFQEDMLFNVINSDIKIKQFANEVWNIINQNLLDSLKNWLIIYPLLRISTESFRLKYDGISVLNSNDKKGWDDLAEKYSALEHWDPKTGKTLGKDSSIFSKNPPDSWLLCEINGTKNGAIRGASNLMRKFIGVLSAHLFEQNSSIIKKSEKREISYSPQVSSDKKSNYTYSHIGCLLHSMLIDLEVSNKVIDNIKNWYEKQAISPQKKSDRASKGARFIQYGLTRNTELDKFIHYFISLDALFGKKGQVEDSIINCISKIYSKNKDKINIERSKKLYKLRSKLVHGEVSYINEWDKIIDYKKHFKSKPLYDVQKISMESLIRYFEI